VSNQVSNREILVTLLFKLFPAIAILAFGARWLDEYLTGIGVHVHPLARSIVVTSLMILIVYITAGRMLGRLKDSAKSNLP
jgi:hypothetical protein